MTRALLQVIHTGGIDLLWHILTSLEIPHPESYQNISTQVSISEPDKEASVFDGMVSLYPFEMIIESKVNNNPVNSHQLDKYKKIVDQKREAGIDALLLYITSDAKIPEIIKHYSDTVFWCSWEDIFRIIEAYPEISIKSDDIFKGLRGVWDEINKIPPRIPHKRLVAILAGRIAYPRAIERGIYNCQPGRFFRNAPYIAFYAERQIAKIFRIIDGPFSNDGKYPDLPETDDFYLIEPVDGIITDPIINDDFDERGNLRPLTMGVPRYADLKTFSIAHTITELKKMNNLK